MALPRRHAGRAGHLTTRFPIQPERAALAATLREVQEWTGQRPERERLGRSIMDALGGEPYDQSRLRRHGGKELVIAEAEGTELPPGLAWLSKVESLRFCENAPRTPLHSGNLPPNLTKLDLSDTDLEKFPDIRGLNRLLHLDLSGTPLTHIPAWVAKLPDRLDIDLGNIPPDAARMLKELAGGPRYVHFTSNFRPAWVWPHQARLREVWNTWAEGGHERENRSEMVKLILEAFSAPGNEKPGLFAENSLMRELPPHLDMVPFHHVQLPKGLDTSIDLGKLLPREIQHLDISFCGLGDLRIAGLHNLCVLEAADNRFREPPELPALPALSVLDLSASDMPFVPRLDHLPELGEVRLANNDISKFPDIRECVSLTRIDLRRNRLDTIPDWIATLPTETEILLQDNPLDEASLDLLRKLNRPSIQFGASPDGIVKQPASAAGT